MLDPAHPFGAYFILAAHCHNPLHVERIATLECQATAPRFKPCSHLIG